MKRIAPLALASLALLGMPASADSGIREVPVQFPKGQEGVTLKGHLKGNETVDYQLYAGAGQTMNVTLKSSNRMNYFNVLPPRSGTALFVGADSGNHYSGTLPKRGPYSVRVYLMRAAARRNETADYTLDVQITGK